MTSVRFEHEEVGLIGVSIDELAIFVDAVENIWKSLARCWLVSIRIVSVPVEEVQADSNLGRILVKVGVFAVPDSFANELVPELLPHAPSVTK